MMLMILSGAGKVSSSLHVCSFLAAFKMGCSAKRLLCFLKITTIPWNMQENFTFVTDEMDVSKNRDTPKSSILIGFPQIIYFNRVFHYKPSIWGYHYFWKHPNVHRQNFHLHRPAAVLRFWLVVQPKLTSLGLLQVIRTEESQNSSLILVISLLTLGAGGSNKNSRKRLEFPSLPVRFC